MAATKSPAPYALIGDPSAAASPLVFDSPHSWRDWPADGTPTSAPASAVKTSWDAFVDELWAEALDGSAPLLAARFHRAYIDANRPRDDIDPALLAAPWPGPLNPGPTSRRGMGLIRRLALPGVPMYTHLLSVEDVSGRIERCYDPYHAKLAALVEAAHARFGMSVHVDCHSMKSTGNAMNVDSGAARPDIVVSDLEGRSADPFLVRWIAASLGSLGYRVQINHPYRGEELVRRHGRPASGRHSVQIEINRALYMDEARFMRHAGAARLVRDLASFVRQLAAGLSAEFLPRLQAPLDSPPQQE
ncbi:N-formylglutamate amidohydrolase [Aquabacterium sp.]|uniref:N-formylglutamate amidohydrolase n=1 Tax=Aquabacterium sp. TaxID=1872578 RepID=UPI003782ED3B